MAASDSDRVGFHRDYADIKSYFGPCVRASPHLSIGVPVRVALPANVIAPHIARASESGEPHLQSEEIAERLYDTAMPTIGPTGSAAEEVSACHDALAYSGFIQLSSRLAQLELGRSSVGISSLESVLVVGVPA